MVITTLLYFSLKSLFKSSTSGSGALVDAMLDTKPNESVNHRLKGHHKFRKYDRKGMKIVCLVELVEIMDVEDERTILALNGNSTMAIPVWKRTQKLKQTTTKQAVLGGIDIKISEPKSKEQKTAK